MFKKIKRKKLAILTPLLFVTSCLFLTTQSNADTLTNEQKNNKFIATLNSTEKSIQQVIPTWHHSVKNNYTLKGAASEQALIKKLTALTSISDICKEGLGSESLCTEGATFQNGLEYHHTKLGAPVTIAGFTQPGFNTLLKERLQDEDSLLSRDNATYIVLYDVNDYTSTYKTDQNISAITLIESDLKAIIQRELLAPSSCMFCGMFDSLVTPEQALATADLLVKASTELLRYQHLTTKHCILDEPTIEKVNRIRHDTSHLKTFWLSNEQTQQYSQCIENALQKDGLNVEYQTANELLNMVVTILQKDLLQEDILTELVYEDPDLKRMVNDLMQIIQLSNRYKDRYDLQVKRQDEGVLSVSVQPPPFSINGMDCHTNKEYCMDRSTSILTDSNHRDEDELKCKVSLLNYKGKTCEFISGLIYFPEIMLNREFEEFAGIDVYYFKLNTAIKDKTSFIPFYNHDVYSLTKAHQEVLSTDTIILTLTEQAQSPSYSANKVWVVEAINLD